MTVSPSVLHDDPAAASAAVTRPKPAGAIERVRIAHITSSRFFGGPERQMLELAQELAPGFDSSFISFSEGGLSEQFLNQVRSAGFQAVGLRNDTPHLLAAGRELSRRLSEMRAAVLCVHGYKAGLLGLLAGRRLRLPVIAVSRGWTAESRRIRLYEKLDRFILRYMDRVICVSHGQAAKVRAAGVPADKVSVIHNAIRTERFAAEPVPGYRQQLEKHFGAQPPQLIIGAAGRLSPEKAFDLLVEAAAKVLRSRSDVGFILFGDGALRDQLQQQIAQAGISQRFVLAGFTSELDHFMRHFDVFVQSSHTEGLPNVLLEAAAAGVPVVATDVGGTSEVVVDRNTGLIVPPANAQMLAQAVIELLASSELRAAMGTKASQYVRDHYTFTAQAAAYKDLFANVLDSLDYCSLPGVAK